MQFVTKYKFLIHCFLQVFTQLMFPSLLHCTTLGSFILFMDLPFTTEVIWRSHTAKMSKCSAQISLSPQYTDQQFIYQS